METSGRPFKFKRAQRLRCSGDFDRIFNRRCAAHASAIGVYVDGNDLGFARLGMRVGKRAGKAALRVRSRRRLREAFRRIQHDLPAMDYIVIIRSTDLNSKQYETLLQELAGRAIRKYSRSP